MLFRYQQEDLKLLVSTAIGFNTQMFIGRPAAYQKPCAAVFHTPAAPDAEWVVELKDNAFAVFEQQGFIRNLEQFVWILTPTAFEAVKNDFAAPQPTQPATSQTNYVYNSGTIGTLSQMNVSSAERHAASEALGIVRAMLSKVPDGIAGQAAEQLDAIDSELKSGQPATAKVKACFGLAAMLLKDYGPPVAALIQAAHAVGLDVWLKKLLGHA